MPPDYFVLVCGARDWDDYMMILRVLRDLDQRCNNVSEQLHVISGAQRAEGDDDNWVGADWLAIEACMELQVPFHGYPAQWRLARERYGKHWRRAGHDRNEWQLRHNRSKLREAHAFHDNLEISRGTKDMVRRLRLAEIKIYLHSHDGGTYHGSR
jgi:hypothetical protein